MEHKKWIGVVNIEGRETGKELSGDDCLRQSWKSTIGKKCTDLREFNEVGKEILGDGTWEMWQTDNRIKLDSWVFLMGDTVIHRDWKQTMGQLSHNWTRVKWQFQYRKGGDIK